MTDENVDDHTLALLRKMDAKLDRMEALATRTATDVAALKQADGAILSMLGGFDDGANATRREVDKLRERIERLESAMAGD